MRGHQHCCVGERSGGQVQSGSPRSMLSPFTVKLPSVAQQSVGARPHQEGHISALHVVLCGLLLSEPVDEGSG